MALMQPLVATLVSEIQTFEGAPQLIALVPRFAAVVNGLRIPGGEKKAAVLVGLHTLTAELAKADKVTASLQAELDAFIDTVMPVTVDTLIAVARGEGANLKRVGVTCLSVLASLLCRSVASAAPVAPAAPVVPVAPAAAAIATIEAAVVATTEVIVTEIATKAEEVVEKPTEKPTEKPITTNDAKVE